VSGSFGEGSVQLFSGSASVTAGPTYYLGSEALAGTVPSSYVQVTSTDQQNPTMGADYVLFSGLTGGAGTTYSFDLSAPNNASSSFNSDGAFISAVEIVQISTNSSGSAPVITSATTASGTVGSAFSYQIAASNSPTSYTATGLPAGLSVNTTNGLISGAPTTAGTSSVTISASNASGTGSATLTLTVNSAGNAPGAPTWITASGSATSVTVNWGSSSGATSYEIYRGTSSGGETLLISGVTSTSYTDTSVTNGTTYYYKVVAVNGSGSSSYSSEANDFPNSTGGTGDINLAGYTLTFDDEFNSLSLSSSSPKGSANWYGYPAYGGAGWFSASAWNPTAFSVSGGVLNDLCWSNRTLINGQHWQSGIMCSVDTTGAGFSQQYGYFEIRCEMPNAGDGAWPAFWLDTTSGLTGGTNEEIDILEWYGICNTPGSYQAFMQEASHSWSPNGSENPPGVPYLYSPQTPMPGGAYPWQGYHTYGFLVTTSTMTWYIDGVQEHQIATPTAYLRTPFYILVDYALGGGWPLDGTPFTTGGSSSLLVDWVRVWSVPPAPPNAIPLSVSQASGSVTLTWTNSVFTLESASNINGPYTTVMRATSPYTESASGTQKFYRLYWNGQ
jgi:hypothetical protein